jgi:hypothetical protein
LSACDNMTSTGWRCNMLSDDDTISDIFHVTGMTAFITLVQAEMLAAD